MSQIPTLIVIDFETTGLDPFNDYPVQVAAVVVNNGTFVEEYSAYINAPEEAKQRPGFLAAQKVHQIPDSKIFGGGADQKAVVERFESLRATYPRAIISGQNIHFDYHLLRRLYERVGASFLWKHRCVDLATLGYVRFGTGKSIEIFQNLGMEIEEDRAHDAAQDARWTASAILDIWRSINV